MSKGGGGLAGLIDSGPLARQSRRTRGLGARQAGPDRACFSCSEIGTALNCPGRLSLPSPFLYHFQKLKPCEVESLDIWILFCHVVKFEKMKLTFSQEKIGAFFLSSPIMEFFVILQFCTKGIRLYLVTAN